MAHRLPPGKDDCMNDKIYRACAYLRLSREDEDKRGGMDESNSIKSQRMMIESFVRGLTGKRGL